MYVVDALVDHYRNGFCQRGSSWILAILIPLRKVQLFIRCEFNFNSSQGQARFESKLTPS